MSDARNQLRAKLLQTRVPKKKLITFFGEQIELRQPSLGDILDVRDEEDRSKAMIRTLVQYAYVPGTDERVFEDGDEDSLRAQPWGADFNVLAEAIKDLTNVNFADQKPSSESTQPTSSSTESVTN